MNVSYGLSSPSGKNLLTSYSHQTHQTRNSGVSLLQKRAAVVPIFFLSLIYLSQIFRDFVPSCFRDKSFIKKSRCHHFSNNDTKESLTPYSILFLCLSAFAPLREDVFPNNANKESLTPLVLPATFFLTKRPIIGTHTTYGCKKKENYRCSVL